MSRYKDLKTAVEWDKAGYKLRKNAKGEEKVSNYVYHTYSIYYSEADVIPKTARELEKEKRKRAKERERKKIEKLLNEQSKRLKSEFKRKSKISQLNLTKSVLASVGQELYIVHVKKQYYSHCTYVGIAGFKKGDKVLVNYGYDNNELIGIIEGPVKELYEDFPLGLKRIIRKLDDDAVVDNQNYHDYDCGYC